MDFVHIPSFLIRIVNKEKIEFRENENDKIFYHIRKSKYPANEGRKCYSAFIGVIDIEYVVTYIVPTIQIFVQTLQLYKRSWGRASKNLTFVHELLVELNYTHSVL